MVPVTVHRIALNRDQIEEYHLPENPAKLSDARAARYVEEHGDSSWELDALDLQVLADITEKAILGLRNDFTWQQSCARQEADREKMHDLVEHFSEGNATDLD